MRHNYNGPPRTLVCPKHPEKAVTLYSLPTAEAWCPCGKPLKEPKSTSMRGLKPRG